MARDINSPMAKAASVAVLLFLGTSHQVMAGESEFFRFTDPQLDPGDVRKKVITPTMIPKAIPVSVLKISDPNMAKGTKGEIVQITYSVPEPAMVRLRVLRKDTRELFLSTILNFEYRDAGRHTEQWDGGDYWGRVVDPTERPYSFLFEAESVLDEGVASEYEGLAYEPGMSQSQSEGASDFDPSLGHIHGLHRHESENVPLLKIQTPAPGATLSGVVPIRSAVDRLRRGYGDKYGYGVRYYVDDELLHEEFYKPEGGGEFYWELDTTALEDGRRLLYIGMCDHNAHTTSEGFYVVINNAAALDP